MTRLTRCSVVVMAACCLCAGPANADEPPVAPSESSEQDRAAALVLFQEGRDRLGDDDFDGGCPKFEAALALWSSASTVLNIARCHLHYGRVASAWSSYKRARVLNRETLGDERRKDLEAIARAGLEQMEARLPRLQVVLDAPSLAPPGITIELGGKPYPAAILEQALPVDPGVVTITVSAPGFVSATQQATIDEGATSQAHIRLSPAAPPLTLDPSPVGVPPPPAPVALPPAEKPEPSGVPVWAWAVGGIGLACAGVSIAFLVDDLAAIDRLQDENNCHQEGDETVCRIDYDVDADNARKNRGFGLFLGFGIASVGLLTASAIGIGQGLSDSGGSSAWVSPYVGDGGGGVVVQGRF